MASGDQQTELLKDGADFLKMGMEQQKRLLAMADEADKSLQVLAKQSNVHEDVRGMLRAAAGKARLLANKRIQQFLGLCEKNINPQPDEPFKTTVEDLTGFYDLVNIEIADVNKAFAQIEELQKDGWRLPRDPQPMARLSKPAKAVTPARAGRSTASGLRGKAAKKTEK